jgi:hypothetical protein
LLDAAGDGLRFAVGLDVVCFNCADRFSPKRSRVGCYVIPTDEELMIAEHVAALHACAPLFFDVAHTGHVKDNRSRPPLVARASKLALLIERRELYANEDAIASD